MLIGLIGKANVGKSTFFNAATELNVQTANYPFTTISPNVGVAHLRVKCVCTEFDVQDNPSHSVCINGNRFIPVKLIDIAGLVPGAHTGRGLGNKFLDDARQADALIHVVDASGSTDGEGRIIAYNDHNPLSDIKFVEEEFDLWIASIVGKEWSRIASEIQNQRQSIERLLAKKLSWLGIDEKYITDALNELTLYSKKAPSWSEEDILNFCKVIRRTTKPILIAANKIDLPSAGKNIQNIKLFEENLVPCSAEAEVLLTRAVKKGILKYLPGDSTFQIQPGVSLSDQQSKALEAVNTIILRYKSTGVQNAINQICFKLLKCIVVYPVEDTLKLMDKNGNILPDAHIVSEGSTAKDLARIIHADLSKGFLYAIDARSKQKLSADYKLKNNDVIKIVSATTRR